jgi:hypothetical protein
MSKIWSAESGGSFMHKFLGIVPIVGIAVSIAASVHATPVINLTSPGGTYQSGYYTLGFTFTVSAPETVNALGVFDDGDAVLPNNAEVGLWNSSGDLLTSVTVPASGATAVGDFVYASITPYDLTPGQAYTVGAYLPGGVGSSFGVNEGGAGSFSPLVTVLYDSYNDNSYLSFPSDSEGVVGAWLGANLDISVPEPAEWILMLMGVSLLGARLRRRAASVRA